MRENLARPKQSGDVKLNLACGDRPIDGFIGVDKFRTPAVDKVCDLLRFPWPWKANSVDEVMCSHFFEHVPRLLRPRFMEELHRILKPGAKAVIVTPWAWSSRSVQDFTHEWPPIVPGSYLYFNKKWREDNKLTHGPYKIACDFDFGYGFGLSPEFAPRNAETQQFAVSHYIEGASDLHVTLTKRG